MWSVQKKVKSYAKLGKIGGKISVIYEKLVYCHYSAVAFEFAMFLCRYIIKYKMEESTIRIQWHD